MIAEGIIGAVQEVGIQVPVIVRLEGNNAEQGRELLRQSGLDLTAVQGLVEAAQTAVEAIKD